MLDLMLERSHDFHDDNFDKWRFKKEEPFSAEKHRRYLCFFLDNYKELYETYRLLQDQASKELFIELILYRILGYRHIKLSTNTPDFWEKRAVVDACVIGPSKLEFKAKLGNLNCSEIDYSGIRIKYDGLGVRNFVMQQYRFNMEGVQISPGDGDFVLDLGACLGNTALQFAADVGPNGRVYSFDFMPSHRVVFEHNKQ